MMWDVLWLDARLATMTAGGRPYGMLEDGAIAVQDGRIAWIGRHDDLEGPPAALAKQVHWIDGRWITPGFIDCHTHLVYGGNRAREFEQRLEGASYAEIARAGGGILSTVRATREADDAALYRDAVPRLKALMAEGVTTVEIKSGYGLESAAEARQLSVARRLGESFPIEVITTFLGAHALPPEFEGDADGYISYVIETMLPDVAETGLADAVDAFCETIAFTPEQTERVLSAARRHDLPVKLHADQLSDLGGAGLAAKYGALSADHVEYTSEESVAAMARAGTVATLLPGAFYCLRETQQPPVAAFRRAGVPMALATDSNPGSSPVTSLLLMLSMGCTLFRLTPEEALAGVTRNAARALGLADDRGTLEVGKRADLCVWDIDHPAELAYRVGFNPLAYAVKDGRVRQV
ncbi:imidazolonepropionase [Ferruginivarius sediminum]|uniref:Imidazolonepropionase n=1 Tax=Ferruginivarius sediminum TaxID=2661937 RepID=A0A369TH42_9PROT|nr:imidazolonepropionase [Ferruginivarius sediminum]RDD63695.1 imidazolonepropionase [Ferruginivarius sediminum]